MKKYVIGFLIFTAVFGVGAFKANAESMSIGQLVNLLITLGIISPDKAEAARAAVANGNNSSSSSFCHTWNNNLKYGDKGNADSDVAALQDALNRENFNVPDYVASGIDGSTAFEDFTAAAVVKFQGKYGIPQTGYVGPLTRAKLNSMYGCNSNVGVNTATTNTPVVNTPASALPVAIPSTTVTIRPSITSVQSAGNPTNTISANEYANIYGAGLSGQLSIRISASDPINAVGTSDGFVRFLVPSLPAGSPAVYVTNSSGQTSAGYIVTLTNVTSSNQNQNYKPVITMVRAKASDDFEAYVGEDLSIEGSYLAGNSVSTTNVYLGGMRATIKQIGDNLLWITTPELASGTYDLTVSNEKGTSNPVKVNVHSRQIQSTPIASINYVQSPAEDQNILHPGERATIYGTNLNTGNVYVHLLEKAQDEKITPFNIYQGSLDFTVPTLSDGDWDVYLEQAGNTSNKIRVKVINPQSSNGAAVFFGADEVAKLINALR